MSPDEDETNQDNATEWIYGQRQDFFEDEIAHKIMLRELTGKLFQDLGNSFWKLWFQYAHDNCCANS